MKKITLILFALCFTYKGITLSMESTRSTPTKREANEPSESSAPKKLKSEASSSEHKEDDDFNIGIIGATGHVGSSTVASLKLDDIPSNLLLWSRKFEQSSSLARDCLRSRNYKAVRKLEDIAQSNTIIITAGVHKPVSRDALLSLNKPLIQHFIQSLNNSPNKNQNATIIIATNPVEDLAQYALLCAKRYGYLSNPQRQIFGSGTSVDTDRLCCLLTEEGFTRDDMHNAYVLGEHGDNQFVAWSQVKIGEQPLVLTTDQKTRVAEQTKNMGYEIAKVLGYTMLTIAGCLKDICVAIRDGGTLPVSVYDERHEVYLSLPARLGRSGVQEIVDLPLDPDEQAKLQVCIDKRRAVLQQLLADESESSSSR